MDGTTSPRIAVLLPCYNEEAAIVRTIEGFRSALPGAALYVYDNNSRDRTVELARAAGAEVRTERMQGKGHVVRRMFADVDADVYIMADGDLTYDPAAAPAMVKLLLDDRLDMVVGTRLHEAKDAYRGGHVIGNRVFTGLLSRLFGRSFSRHFLGLPGVLAALRQKLPGAVAKGSRSRPKSRSTRSNCGCRSARSRPLMARGPRGRNPSCRPSATAGGS